MKKRKIKQVIYNRFAGSLEHLKGLTKLKYLHISNTDIDRGINYLSDGIREIYPVRKFGKNLKAILQKNSRKVW